jgi:hypothetical protein
MDVPFVLNTVLSTGVDGEFVGLFAATTGRFSRTVSGSWLYPGRRALDNSPCGPL